MSRDIPGEEGRVGEIRIKLQALVDNELPASEIDEVLEEIQGSYEYRAEYAQLLKLRRELRAGIAEPTSQEWLARAERRIMRRVSRGVGTALLLGSYAILFGYALFTLFGDPEVPVIVSVLVAAGTLGFTVLLVNAIGDRVRERKTDRYRGIIR